MLQALPPTDRLRGNITVPSTLGSYKCALGSEDLDR